MTAYWKTSDIKQISEWINVDIKGADMKNIAYI